jgi:hypothetical protein
VGAMAHRSLQGAGPVWISVVVSPRWCRRTRRLRAVEVRRSRRFDQALVTEGGRFGRAAAGSTRVARGRGRGNGTSNGVGRGSERAPRFIPRRKSQRTRGPPLGGPGAWQRHGRSLPTDVARIVRDRETDGHGRGVMASESTCCRAARRTLSCKVMRARRTAGARAAETVGHNSRLHRTGCARR